MAIETNNNLYKLNQTSGTSSTGSTQTPPYISATDRALISGASVFDIAKSQANKGTNSTKSTGSGKSQANSAVASANAAKSNGEKQTNVAEASKAKSEESAQNVKELSATSKINSTKAAKEITNNTKQISTWAQKSTALGSEIEELEAEKASLNPFDGTGSGVNSAFSLNIASSSADDSTEKLGNSANGDDKKNQEAQQKLEDINTKIASKTEQKTGVDTKTKATLTTATTKYAYNIKQLNLTTNQVKKAQQVATTAKAGADAIMTIGAATTAAGVVTSTVGSMLASNPVTAPSAPPPIASGGATQATGAATTAAGSAAGAAATATAQVATTAAQATAASTSMFVSIGNTLQNVGKIASAAAQLKSATQST